MPLSRRSVLRAAGASVATAAATSVAGPFVAPAYSAGRRIAIIGSGYGGAVAARSLATAGYACDIIEMGTDWSRMTPTSDGRVHPTMANPNERAGWFLDRTEMPFSNILGSPINQPIGRAAGILGIERFAAMKVYVGKGVGGGSLVNGGMAVTPKRAFFSSVLPTVDADEMYGTYFPRANTMLGARPPALDVLNYAPHYQFARLGATQARNAKYAVAQVPNVYDWDYMREEVAKNVPRSALAQEVIFGNNHGKKDLTKTVLKDALATGLVRVTPLTEVTDLRRLPDGAYELSLKTIDFKGAVLSRRTAVYDRVVLAAGSVGTTRLLLQAQAKGGLTGLSPSVGKGWGPNGNVMAARYLWTKAVGREQSGIPALGIDAWDGSAASVFAEIAPFPTGIETFTSVYLAITNNPNRGTFTWDPTTGSMTLDWNATMAKPSVDALKAVVNRLNTYNGGTVRSDLFDDGKQYADYFTYHPLGGAVLGEATDLSGEVKGAEGLFVMDGSLIPAKIGVNPFVTITAIAQRNMDRLIAAGRFA